MCLVRSNVRAKRATPLALSLSEELGRNTVECECRLRPTAQRSLRKAPSTKHVEKLYSFSVSGLAAVNKIPTESMTY